MESKNNLLTNAEIENRIYSIRGLQVMIDSDLAEMYNVETKALNQAVKRNIMRFPNSFRFQLMDNEKTELVTNCDRFKKLKHSSNNPFAYTEQGVAMLSAVLRSETAVNVSIQIMQTFVEMRKLLINNAGLLQRVEKIETKLIVSDANFEKIFNAMLDKEVKKENIFFAGQIYDAYSFVIQLIEKANTEIVLIDNYVDNSVLDMISKKKEGVSVTIYTHQGTKLTDHDVTKFNKQYPTLSLKHTSKMHDRFLLIDKSELYHIGASLKDLGNKCFAFSLIEDQELITNLLNRL